MGKITCPCLNINIHVKGAVLQRMDSTLLGLSIDQLREPFFETDLAEVKLDLGGVAEEQAYLVHKTKVGDWNVRTCVNCNTPSYAVHATKGQGRVLVNMGLLADEKQQERVQALADFSPLFKVLLKDSGEKSTSSSLVHPMTGNQQGIRKTVTHLQEHLTKYLSRERLSMEERIRRYSEEQKAVFAELQKRAYRDKNLMVGVILSAEEKSLEDSLSDAMLDSTLTPPTTPIQRPGTVQSNNDIVASSLPSSRPPLRHFASASTPRSRPIPQQVHRTMHSSMARSVPTHGHHRHVTSSRSDADTMFDLEGFAQDEEPFFESDESSTDDNSLNEENLAGPISTLSREHAEYATSLPISMPLWKKEDHVGFEENSMEEKEPMPEPERMMASMRALSHSVQDGTEMFGDLPRPRLNTVGETTIVKKGARR